MVLDTSAIIAMLFDEPEAEMFERQIADDPLRLLSAGSVIEAGIIIESRLGDAGGREFDLWLQRAAVEIVPVDVEQTEMARRAWRRFGKGRHPASLNYGDCFAYALAATRDEPLLFKGSDFVKTDVKRCIQEI
jgi:ribonuclease VapC